MQFLRADRRMCVHSLLGIILPITPPICDRCGDPLARQNESQPQIPNPVRALLR